MSTDCTATPAVDEAALARGSAWLQQQGTTLCSLQGGRAQLLGGERALGVCSLARGSIGWAWVAPAGALDCSAGARLQPSAIKPITPMERPVAAAWAPDATAGGLWTVGQHHCRGRGLSGAPGSSLTWKSVEGW
jgi:hypothetical protein